MPQRTFRFTFAIVLSLFAVFVFLLTLTPSVADAQSATPAPTATPVCGPGYDWTPWGGCRPVVQPCPAGTIDLNGNGNNDGGDDCQALDILPRPSNCAPRPGGPHLTRRGHVACALPWSLNGQSLQVLGAAGCMDVTRTPYPRAMVGLQTTFAITGLFPQVNNIAEGQPGWYRLQSGNSWATEGQYLHERYGHITVDSRGQLAFNTNAVLAGDSHPYPSLNNVRAQLVFSLPPADDSFRWSVMGLSGASGGGLSQPMEKIFAFSSYPDGRPYPISYYGPDKDGLNRLPAFRLQLRSTWGLYYLVEWDNFYVNGNNAYVRGTHEQHVVPLGQYFAYRAWDERQTVDSPSVELLYCNASPSGYIPVPVVEAQSVITR